MFELGGKKKTQPKVSIATFQISINHKGDITPSKDTNHVLK